MFSVQSYNIPPPYARPKVWFVKEGLRQPDEDKPSNTSFHAALTTFGPNVKGGNLYTFTDYINTDGAFYVQNDSGILWTLPSSAGTVKRIQYGFNASLSNSIYTDLGVVRPLGLALNYIIKV